LTDDDDDAIAPDVTLREERQKFGESSLDENRDDQFDAHHAAPDEHV
jgi:hypothetical protein